MGVQMTYQRHPLHHLIDHQKSKEFETTVKLALPHHTVDQTTSSTKLDFWVPGYVIDVKEKCQRLTKGWHVLEIGEEDMFVLDELGYRKALEKFPYAFFLLHDRMTSRKFLAPIWELACCERIRLNRVAKGKLVIDMTQFHPIKLEDVHDVATRLLSEMPWKQTECVGLVDVAQVKYVKA